MLESALIFFSALEPFERAGSPYSTGVLENVQGAFYCIVNTFCNSNDFRSQYYFYTIFRRRQ